MRFEPKLNRLVASSSSSRSSSDTSSSSSASATSSGSNSASSHSSSSSSASPSATRSAGPESQATSSQSASMTSSKGSSTSQSAARKTTNGNLSGTGSSTQTSSSSSSSSSSASSSKSSSNTSSTKAASTSSRTAQSAVSAAPIGSPTSQASTSVPASASSTAQSSATAAVSTQVSVPASSAAASSQASFGTSLAITAGATMAVPTTLLASTPTLIATTISANGGAADTSALVLGTFSGTASTFNGAATVTPGSSQLSSTSGFLQKPGAVVGTFVGVGVILAAVMAFAVCFWRRRHYRKQGTEFSGSAFGWPPPTPAISYSDLRMPVSDSPPPISSFAVDLNRKPSVIWGPRPTSDEDAAMTEDTGMLERGHGPSPPQTAYTPQEPRGVGLARVESRGPPEHDPFGDLYAIQEASTTGLAITTGHPLFRQSTQSYAVSTPSVYSEKTHEDDSSIYQEAYSGTDHTSLAHLNRNANSASPPSTLSYSPQPPSPNPVSARPMMSEVTRIQGHQMVRSGPSQRL